MNKAHYLFRTYGQLTLGEKSKQLKQNPLTFWIPGLSGSGKSTLAYALESHLFNNNIKVAVLDGDNLRHGINQDLDFSHTSRSEAIRRTAEIAKILNDAGLVVIVSLISPFLVERANAKLIIGQQQFVEIYMNTPLEVCEARDVKGIYQKARRGELDNFTGVSSPYESPLYPDFSINAAQSHPLKEAEEIFSLTRTRILEPS